MGKYIDKEEVIKEIKKQIDLDTKYGSNVYDCCNDILSFIDILEVKEIEPTKVPKHSYFETIYHCGTEPMWKIGDVLAVYEFYSDREGEYVYGEVIDVKMDEYYSDWVYTFKGDFGGYEDICENTLISEQAYKKNK